MQAQSILLPLCAQVLLTLTVRVWNYIARIGAIQRSGIDIQASAYLAASFVLWASWARIALQVLA